MKKRIISFILAMLCVLIVTPNEVKAANKYGFSYDSDVYNVKWSTMYSFNVYTDLGTKLGTCSYVVGLAREKDTNNFVLMTKEIMTPNNSKVKISNCKHGYGFSEYVSVKVELPTLDDYKPQNEPSKDTLSFSIGADLSGANVGASYSITHSDLDITSSCNTTTNTYHIKYNYKPSLINPFASNKYVANESVQLGAATFHKSKNKILFTMYYDARFGAAYNNSASPLLVFAGYVEKQTLSKEF